MSCKNKLSDECFNKLGDYIDNLPSTKGTLISCLHKAQEIFGYLPPEVQEYVADRLDIPLAKIYGVVSFYSFFTMKPKGKHAVSVCMGTACYVRGADKVLDEFKKELDLEVGETSADGLFSIDALRCVGACGLAPVVMVGERVFGRVTPGEVSSIIEECRKS